MKSRPSRMYRFMLVVFCLLLISEAQRSNAENFTWVYIDGNYSCQVGSGTARKNYKIITVSEVFAICLNEMDSVRLARSQQRNSDQAAEAKCRGGDLSFSGFLEGYMSGSQAITERNREQFIRRIISSDSSTLTETFYISAPYSRKCR